MRATDEGEGNGVFGAVGSCKRDIGRENVNAYEKKALGQMCDIVDLLSFTEWMSGAEALIYSLFFRKRGFC